MMSDTVDTVFECAPKRQACIERYYEAAARGEVYRWTAPDGTIHTRDVGRREGIPFGGIKQYYDWYTALPALAMERIEKGADPSVVVKEWKRACKTEAIPDHWKRIDSETEKT